MPKPALKLSRLTLRSKLLLLAALPLLPLVAASYLVVVDSIDERRASLAEQDEISRIEAASSLASAVIVERDAFQQSNTVGVRLRLTRERTDVAIEEYLREVADDSGRTATVDSIASEINWIRGTLGDAEATVEMWQEALTILDGEAAVVFQRLDQLVDLSIAEVEVTPGAIQTADGLTDARSVLLLTEFSAGLRSELIGYVAIGEAETTLARFESRSRAAASFDQVQATTQEILALESPEFTGRFKTEILNSEGYGLMTVLRDGALLNPDLAPSASFLPTFTPLFGAVQTLEADLIATSSDRATVRAKRAFFALGGTVLAALLFAGLTLLSVVALYRSIRNPLLSLTKQSRHIAKHELPTTVARIRELGGEAQIEMPAPIEAKSDDEIGELVDAFNQLHSTAIELAAGQAASRRTVSEMFVNLGRRNQKILMRLLASLEKLERNERDPELLHELFKVDHLATRMRRNAESLLVLAGAKTSRSFSQAIPVADVVRSALSEVEDYERVTIDDKASALIIGTAVADIGHLLAELIENALMFSPPASPVEVLVRTGPEGLIVTVGDRGIGLSDEELRANNQQIADAALLTETPSRFLGLYVVGRLAHRHGLTVELLSGVPSGLIARIKFPESVCQAKGDPSPGHSGSRPNLGHEASSEVETSLVAEVSAEGMGSAQAWAADRIADEAPARAVAPVSPAPFAPPAPVHRGMPSEGLVAAPHPHVVTPESHPRLAKRTRVQPLPSTTREAASAPPPVTSTASSDRNLAGLNPAASEFPATPENPIERRRPLPTRPTAASGSQSPHPSSTGSTDLAGGFTAAKRIPGASPLAHKHDQTLHDQPLEAVAQQPRTDSESAPSVAARFGANLAGFQRGVARADTPSESTLENVAPLAQPTAPPGELS
jgi:signal transduction histidine kinase